MPVKPAQRAALSTRAEESVQLLAQIDGKAPDRPAVQIAFKRLIGSLDAPAIEEPFEAANHAETLLRFEADGFEYALVRSRLAGSARLSTREREIVRLVAIGLSNKCIAAT